MIRVGTREGRGENQMTTQDEHSLFGILGVSVVLLLALTTCVIRFLPSDFALVMVSWIMLSVSVGVTFGHCVLNEP